VPGGLCGLGDVPRAARRFAPPAEFAARANVTADWYDVAAADLERFWGGAARRLSWDREWDQVLDWSHPPVPQWFVNGRLNVAVNCVDRHVDAGRGDQVAFYWEGGRGESRALTYARLRDGVCQAANALSALGVRAGDRVAICLPVIPEAVIAMLACARLGAPHVVGFTGLGALALAARMRDCEAKVVITTDGGFSRRPGAVKSVVDRALRECPQVRHVLVVRRTGQAVGWRARRDVWWHELVDTASAEHSPDSFDAEHPLGLLYVADATQPPRALQYTSGGYLTQCAYSHPVLADDRQIPGERALCGTGHDPREHGPGR
jgi:acetyl-CoA synthetase